MHTVTTESPVTIVYLSSALLCEADLSIGVLTELRTFQVNVMMRNEIETATSILAVAFPTIRGTSSFKHKSSNPSNATIQFHNDFAENSIASSIARNGSCRMECILMVNEIVCLDRFFCEIRYREDEFIAVDMREIFERWFRCDLPHHVPPPTKHKSGTFANDHIRIPRASCQQVTKEIPLRVRWTSPPPFQLNLKAE
jgi:hypothetical protein